VDPRAGLDDVKKRKFLTVSGLELRPLGSPARSQLLYQLRYPGSYEYQFITKLKMYDNNKISTNTESDYIKFVRCNLKIYTIFLIVHL
jgi:hypothetical protein